MDSGLEETPEVLEGRHLRLHRRLHGASHQQLLPAAELSVQGEADLRPAVARLESVLTAGAHGAGNRLESDQAVRLEGRHLVIGGDAAPARTLDALPIGAAHPFARTALHVDHAGSPLHRRLAVCHEREDLFDGTMDHHGTLCGWHRSSFGSRPLSSRLRGLYRTFTDHGAPPRTKAIATAGQ